MVQKWRKKVEMKPLPTLVPLTPPDIGRYLIFAGLVFVPLTHSYMMLFDKHWYRTNKYRDLYEIASNGDAEKKGQEVVIISQVLLHKDNMSYQEMTNIPIMKVNNIEILHLKHLREVLDQCIAGNEKNENGNEYILFELKDHRIIVLNIASAKVIHTKLLKEHRILKDQSPDLSM